MLKCPSPEGAATVYVAASLLRSLALTGPASLEQRSSLSCGGPCVARSGFGSPGLFHTERWKQRTWTNPPSRSRRNPPHKRGSDQLRRHGPDSPFQLHASVPMSAKRWARLACLDPGTARECAECQFLVPRPRSSRNERPLQASGPTRNWRVRIDVCVAFAFTRKAAPTCRRSATLGPWLGRRSVPGGSRAAPPRSGSDFRLRFSEAAPRRVPKHPRVRRRRPGGPPPPQLQRLQELQGAKPHPDKSLRSSDSAKDSKSGFRTGGTLSNFTSPERAPPALFAPCVSA